MSTNKNGNTGNVGTLTLSKKSRYLVFTVAFLGLGLSMPSCPGQQAMQQQIDSLQAAQNEAAKKIQALDSEAKAAKTEIAAMKQVTEQMANTVNAQKAAMDQLNTSLTELNAKMATLAKPARPAGKAAPVKAMSKKKGH